MKNREDSLPYVFAFTLIMGLCLLPITLLLAWIKKSQFLGVTGALTLLLEMEGLGWCFFWKRMPFGPLKRLWVLGLTACLWWTLFCSSLGLWEPFLELTFFLTLPAILGYSSLSALALAFQSSVLTEFRLTKILFLLLGIFLAFFMLLAPVPQFPTRLPNKDWGASHPTSPPPHLYKKPHHELLSPTASPANILSSKPFFKSAFEIRSSEDEFSLEDHQETMKAQNPRRHELWIAGYLYELEKIIVYSPSAHTLDGHNFPKEIQIYFKTSHPKAPAARSALAIFADSPKTSPGMGSPPPRTLQDLLPPHLHHYRYLGDDGISPENKVLWNVLADENSQGMKFLQDMHSQKPPPLSQKEPTIGIKFPLAQSF